MSCQVALSGTNFAIIFADSQATSIKDQSEFHGAQKLFAGPDFLVGYVRSVRIGNLVFSKMQSAVAAGTLKAAGLSAFITDCLEAEVRPKHWGDVEFIVATPSPDGRWIQRFQPGTLVNFSERENFGTIGAGSTFVYRSNSTALKAGINAGWKSLATGLVAAKQLMDAAVRSLTVDSTYMLGLCAQGGAYLLGDSRIQPAFVGSRLKANWAAASNSFREMIASTDVVLAQTRDAYRAIHPLSWGAFDPAVIPKIVSANDAIAHQIELLTKQLNDYCHWHDTMVRESRS
jgi:hypothetical protein